MNKRIKVFFSIGVIVIAATIAVLCLLIQDWHGMRSAAFRAIIWAESTFVLGLLLSEYLAEKTEQLLFRSASYVLLTVYAVGAIGLSFLFISSKESMLRLFIVLQIALFAVIAVLLVAIYAFSTRELASNSRTMDAVTQHNDMVQRLILAAIRLGQDEYAPVIKKLAEDLRYMDASSVFPADEKISMAISALETELYKEVMDSNMIKERAETLNQFINERRLQASTIKRGRI